MNQVSKSLKPIVDTAIKELIEGPFVEIRIFTENRINEAKRSVFINNVKIETNIMGWCKLIKKLKFNFLYPADGILREHGEYLKMVFDCCSHNLTSLWLAYGTTEIADAIFKGPHANIIRLILTHYRGDNTNLESIFKDIQIFEVDDMQFDLIPKFTKLKQFSAANFHYTSSMNANIKDYLDNNNSIDNLTLIMGQIVRDPITFADGTMLFSNNSVSLVEALVDFEKYKKVFLSDLAKSRNNHFIYLERNDGLKITLPLERQSTHVKATEFSQRFFDKTIITDLEAIVLSDEQASVLLAYLHSSHAKLTCVDITVGSRKDFIKFASEIQVHLERFAVTWEMKCHSENMFVYEKGGLTGNLSKHSWKILFEQDASEKMFSKFEKFSISITGNARYYVKFEHGEMETNASMFNAEFHRSMKVANFKIPLFSSAPDDKKQSIVNHIRTFIQSNNETQLGIVNIFTDDMDIDVVGWTKRHATVENVKVVQLVR